MALQAEVRHAHLLIEPDQQNEAMIPLSTEGSDAIVQPGETLLRIRMTWWMIVQETQTSFTPEVGSLMAWWLVWSEGNPPPPPAITFDSSVDILWFDAVAPQEFYYATFGSGRSGSPPTYHTIDAKGRRKPAPGLAGSPWFGCYTYQPTSAMTFHFAAAYSVVVGKPPS